MQRIDFGLGLDQYRAAVNPRWLDSLDDLGITREFVSASGSRIVDREGNSFLDFVAGFGAATLGHNHPELDAALEEAIRAPVPNIVPWGITPETGALAVELLALAGGELAKVHFASSGAEAIESALKFAMARTGRRRFLSFGAGFHGLTLGATSLAGGGAWRSMLPAAGADVEVIPAFELDAAASALARRDCAAVFVEIVQGTGGGRSWAPGSFCELRRLCRETGTLLVADEAMTGLGRTGSWFAHHLAGPDGAPDMVIVAKGMTGGKIPLSAVLMTDDIYEAMFGRPGHAKIHGSTFSGNFLAMATGLAVLRITRRHNLVENAARIGAYLRERLAALGHAQGGPILDIQGQGLAIGFKVAGPDGPDDPSGAVDWCLELLAQGVMTMVAAHEPTYIRLTPPLTLSEAEAAEFVAAVVEVSQTRQ